MNKIDFEMCNFSHVHYRACLEHALESGYTFSTMNEVAEGISDDKSIIMRHDEDLSLPAMVRLAEIEASLDIRSTYFVRLHAKNYNLLFFDSYTGLQRMIKMGHEIAFHYELHTHPTFKANESKIIRHSKSLLEAILGVEINGMSYHEPARSLNEGVDRTLPEGIKYEAYEDRFMDNYKYISDSSAHWREGCMCKHIGKTDKLYILTHGFWWFENSPAENY